MLVVPGLLLYDMNINYVSIKPAPQWYTEVFP